MAESRPIEGNESDKRTLGIENIGSGSYTEDIWKIFKYSCSAC